MQNIEFNRSRILHYIDHGSVKLNCWKGKGQITLILTGFTLRLYFLSDFKGLWHEAGYTSTLEQIAVLGGDWYWDFFIYKTTKMS